MSFWKFTKYLFIWIFILFPILAGLLFLSATFWELIYVVVFGGPTTSTTPFPNSYKI